MFDHRDGAELVCWHPLLDDLAAIAVLSAAQRELPPVRIREMHEKAERRMRGLLERGQEEGAFRADLPVSWLLAVTHLTMTAAAEEATAGRLEADDAARAITSTLLPAFAADRTPECPGCRG